MRNCAKRELRFLSRIQKVKRRKMKFYDLIFVCKFLDLISQNAYPRAWRLIRNVLYMMKLIFDTDRDKNWNSTFAKASHHVYPVFRKFRRCCGIPKRVLAFLEFTIIVKEVKWNTFLQIKLVSVSIFYFTLTFDRYCYHVISDNKNKIFNLKKYIYIVKKYTTMY